MTTQTEALKLALEALESCGSGHITDGGNQWYDEKLVDNSITAIKEALAQPEQQPVAQLKELEATEKQVEILTDELAKCQRMVETLSQPKEPEQKIVAWMNEEKTDAVFEAVEMRIPDWKDYYYIPLYEIPPQPKEPEQEPWLLETTQILAKYMAREFYPEVTQWECLDNLAGVISQIDNMTTGLMRKPKQEPVAWAENDGDGNVLWNRDSCFSDDPEWLDNPMPLYTTPPQRTWVGLTEEDDIDWEDGGNLRDLVKAIEAKLKEKNI